MRALRSGILAATLFTLASCGDCGTSGGPAGPPRQDLVFTGPAPGTLTSAKTDCHLFTDQTQFNALLTGTLGGKELTFNIQVYSAYNGSGTYQVGSTLDSSANLRLQIGTWVGSSTTGAGTLTINADGKSGALDSDVGGGEHVKGTFACSEVKTG